MGLGIAAVEEVQQLLVDQAPDARAAGHLLAVDFVDALAAVEKRHAPRVHRQAALDRRADVDGAAGLQAVLQVEEVDVAVQRGVDHLGQAVLVLLGAGDVHPRAQVRRPADDAGLARPAHAAPGVDDADALLPGHEQPLRVLGDLAVSAAVAVVAAPEGGHALQACVPGGGAHVDLHVRGARLVRVHVGAGQQAVALGVGVVRPGGGQL